ncbi:hypothetical protein GOP47_0023759 [Adiantum capillus-veneris]|uniref:Ubiquitin-like protease family profile domain-containing protein n=1 Tax=Adiantum capillus-veneris TaxID=13818 RepID=A0A9D4Z4S1_ADICA|nr:hypothetical protein GOP47_0023759 [Adiantum capillus-veneris]
MHIRALQVWKELGGQYKEMDQASFVEEYISGRMKQYMADKDRRLGQIQKRIEEGYDAHKRVHDIPPWLETALDDIDTEDPFQFAPKGEEDHDKSVEKTFEAINTRGDISESLGNLNLDEDHVHTSPSKNKLPIRRGKTSNEPIDVGSPDDCSYMALEFYASYEHLRLEKTGNEICPLSPTRSNRALYRFSSHIPIRLSSIQFGIHVDMDDEVLRFILLNEASTKTMNLFTMWMEHTIAPPNVLNQVMFVDSMWVPVVEASLGKHDGIHVMQNFFGEKDISHCVLTNFSIVIRKHWTLCVMYLSTHMKITSLRGRKHHLLFYDSLGCSAPMDVIPFLHMAMEALGHGASNPIVKHALLEPCSEFEIKLNGIDCGFYVMAAIRYIISSCLGEKSKGWVRKKWFNHDDILMLRKNLHEWCLEVVAKD